MNYKKIILMVIIGLLSQSFSCGGSSPTGDPNNSGFYITYEREVPDIDGLGSDNCSIPQGARFICNNITYEYSSEFVSGKRTKSDPGPNNEVFSTKSIDFANKNVTITVTQVCTFIDIDGTIGQTRTCKDMKTVNIPSGKYINVKMKLICLCN